MGSVQAEKTRIKLLSSLDELQRLLEEMRALVIDHDPEMIQKADDATKGDV